MSKEEAIRTLMLPRDGGFTEEQLRHNFRRLATELTSGNMAHGVSVANAQRVLNVLTAAYRTLRGSQSTPSPPAPPPAHPPPQNNKLDIARFNALFESHRVTDVHDQGYGTWLKSETNSESGSTHAADEDAVWDEPEAATFSRGRAASTFVPYELGIDKVSDFGKRCVLSASRRGIAYADLRLATSDVRAAAPTDEDAIARFSSLDDIVAHRANARFELSDSERAAIRERREQQDKLERKRQQRVSRFDDLAIAAHVEAQRQLVGRVTQPSGI